MWIKTLILFLCFLLNLNAGVYVNGGDEYVSLGSPSDLKMNAWTSLSVSAWVVSTLGGTDEHMICSNWNASYGCMFFRIEPSDGSIEAFVREQPGTSVGGTFNDTTLSASVWYHVAMTWDTTNGVQVYVNGTKDTTSYASSAELINADNPANFLIGYSPHTPTDGLTGQITDFALWQSTLTQAEVSLLADSKIKGMPLQIQPSNLKVYLPLDDHTENTSLSGLNFNDLSGRGNDGTGVETTGSDGRMLGEKILSYPPKPIATN